MVTRRVTLGWGETLQKCAGLIAFDATLCTGPRHINSPAYGLNPYLRLSEHPLAVATIALGGCTRCGNAPEGLTNHSTRRSQQLPVLAPVPALASTLKAAQRPEGASIVGQATFVARCADCIRDRYCTACHQWWCETCYLDSKHMIAHEPVILDVDYDFGSFGMDNSVQTQLMSMGFEAPKHEEMVSRSCWECGMNCSDCIDLTQMSCRSCCGGYCLLHNEGATLAQCDWCSSRGSRVAIRRAVVH